MKQHYMVELVEREERKIKSSQLTGAKIYNISKDSTNILSVPANYLCSTRTNK